MNLIKGFLTRIKNLGKITKIILVIIVVVVIFFIFKSVTASKNATQYQTPKSLRAR